MKNDSIREFLSRYRPTSLRFRLTMLVLVISVFVLVVATTFINDRALSVIEQNSDERLNAANVTLTATVSVWLEPHLNALRNLVSLPDIISMDAERQKPLLQKMAAAYPYMYLISTTDLKGINVARNDNEKPKNYGDREWFLKARDGAAVTFESLIGKTNHRPALIVAMPIKNEADRIVGVCMFATDLENLTRQVRVTRAGKTGFAYLIDQKNRVIAHPDQVYANNLSDFSDYPPVKALRQGTRGQVSFIDEGGQHWRAYVNELNNGWGVVVQQQEEELLSTQRLFHQVALMIIFSAVLILVCTTWWGVVRTLKPINMLTKAVKKVTSDNMNRLDFEFVHSTPLHPKTMDEVSILSDSFYEMAVRLQAAMVSQEQELSERKRAEEELRKHRDRLEDLVKERTTNLTNSNEQLNYEIEERKRVEVALLESQQMLRLVLDSIPVKVFWKDKELNYLGCNQQFANDSGFGSSEEIIGKNDFDMGWAEQAEIYRNDDRLIIETGVQKLNYEEPQTTPDGRKIWLRTSKIPLIDPAGKIKGVLGTYEDITNTKQAELVIKESEERYRLLAENAHDIIFTMDTNLRFTYISPSITRLRGFTVEEAMSQTPEEALSPTSLEVAMKAYLEEMEIEARETKDLYRTRIMELEETCKDGSTIWTETTSSPLRDEKNNFIGFLGITRDITERKQIEEALRESEQRLQVILHGSPIPSFVIGKDHRVIYWNEAIEQLSGVRASNIIGTKEHWRAFYGTERPCMADLIVEGALETIHGWYSEKYSKSNLIDEAYEATDFFTSLGKEGKWLHFTAAAIRNSAGDLVGAIETIEDITERKRVEEALKKSEERYRIVAENARDVIWVFDLNLGYTFTSPSVKYLRGYTVEEALKQSLDQILTPESYQRAKEIFEREISLEMNGKRHSPDWSYTTELEMICKDGSTVWTEVTINILYNEEGTPKGFMGITRDITKRRQAEEALRKSEEEYRFITDNMQDTIWLMDMNFRPIWISPSGVRNRGFTLEEIVNMPLENNLTPESMQRVTQIITENFTPENLNDKDHEIILSSELEFYRKDGSTSWSDVVMTLLRNSDGKPSTLLCVGRDITERRQAEEEKKRLEEQLVRAQKMEAIGTLAGGIAHDFNNLLMGILGNISIMRMNFDDSHPFFNRLTNMEEYVYRGSDLTKQLLGFARGGKYEMKPTHLGEFIRRSSEMFGQTKKRSASITKYRRRSGPWKLIGGKWSRCSSIYM